MITKEQIALVNENPDLWINVEYTKNKTRTVIRGRSFANSALIRIPHIILGTYFDEKMTLPYQEQVPEQAELTKEEKEAIKKQKVATPKVETIVELPKEPTPMVESFEALIEEAVPLQVEIDNQNKQEK